MIVEMMYGHIAEPGQVPSVRTRLGYCTLSLNIIGAILEALVRVHINFSKARLDSFNKLVNLKLDKCPVVSFF